MEVCGKPLDGIRDTAFRCQREAGHAGEHRYEWIARSAPELKPVRNAIEWKDA